MAPVSPARPRDASASPALDISIPHFALKSWPLFRDVHMTVAPGAITCLLGKSGSGKSTLLKLLAGLIETGDIRAAADDGAPIPPRVAYMAQSDLLMPWLSVIDNVCLGARLRGTRAEVARAQSILADVGLADVAHARPQTLSGGMRQRAALARTLMEDRPLVLMDEPFSAVDALTRAELQDLAVRHLAGRTVLLVTHDPLEALRLGARIFVLQGDPATAVEVAPPPGPAPRDAAAVIAQVGTITAALETPQ